MQFTADFSLSPPGLLTERLLKQKGGSRLCRVVAAWRFPLTFFKEQGHLVSTGNFLAPSALQRNASLMVKALDLSNTWWLTNDSQLYHHSSFAGGKIRAQRGEVTCPRAYREEMIVKVFPKANQAKIMFVSLSLGHS